MENLDSRVWQLLQDDRFIKWVKDPDEDTIAWWQQWMAAHPEEVEHLFKAREIARDLAYTEIPIDAQRIADSIWNGIQTDIQSPPLKTTIIEEMPRRNIFARYWPAAAAVMILTIGGIAYFKNRPTPRTNPGAMHQVASRIVKQDLERTNPTGANQQIYLVDGTRITLQPGAGIRHAVYLDKDKREVYLEGNAFFEIAKDAHRPFYVYTKDLVVRVLGTSFKVITNKDNGDVSVLVETGKVAVSKKAGTAATARQLILEPNQQALYKAQTQDLVTATSLSEANQPDMRPLQPVVPFVFDETPVVEIFKRLEKAYGIPMHYDEKTFAACVVTTSLADETFEEKLKVICEAIGANYKIDQTGVTIEGHSCK